HVPGEDDDALDDWIADTRKEDNHDFGD
ncbi:MAG: hypothetical protein CFH40_00834, partial [Alphaproteobacteria bacterium MarineAlpha10_Bin3]